MPEDTINSIISELMGLKGELSGGGIRNAEKKLHSVAMFTQSPEFLEKVSEYLPGSPQLVRAILFVKSIDNNWLVSWHQDKTVAVSGKFEAEGWGPWSKKDDVLHVQAPIEALDQMVTFRVHLDESTEDNGCLKLLPNSHRKGVLSEKEISNSAKANKPVHCVAPSGSALVMRPHVLHASSKSGSANPRRILHVEYSSYQLPQDIKWA